MTEPVSPTSSSRTDSSPRFNSFIFVPFMHHFSPYVRPLNLSFPPINLPASNPSPSPCPPPLACFHLSINRKSLPYTSLPLFILKPELSKTRVSRDVGTLQYLMRWLLRWVDASVKTQKKLRTDHKKPLKDLTIIFPELKPPGHPASHACNRRDFDICLFSTSSSRRVFSLCLFRVSSAAVPD